MPRHNGRPPIKASTLNPNLIDLSGSRPLAECLDCGRWLHLRWHPDNPGYGVLQPHHTPDGRTYPGTSKRLRCPGSAQRFTLDVTTIEWATRRAVATRHAEEIGQAALRRPDGARVRPKTSPPTPRAVHQIAAAR